MITPEDVQNIEERLIKGTKNAIQSLLISQFFLIKTNLKVVNYDFLLHQQLRPVFSDTSRFNVMKFNTLVPDSSFTLPNLFIEELVNPSKVVESECFFLFPANLDLLTGNIVAMQRWLREFYTTIAPTLCCILNREYDFSDTFKTYMPKTYYAVTQQQSTMEGDLNIKQKFNIEEIDKIVAAEYTKHYELLIIGLTKL
jgi:hypothetical protein